MITSESFFITLFIIFVLTVIVLIINLKVKSKAPRYCAAIVYSGLAVLVLAKYGHYILSFNDSVVEKVFKAIYFPNIVVYLTMLFLTLLMLTITIIDEKFSLVTKISNFLCFFTIWFLFVLIVGSVKKDGLNFYEATEIYSSQEIMILIQASMFAFVIWLGIIIMDVTVRKLSNSLDKKSERIEKKDEPKTKKKSIVDIVDAKKNDSAKYIDNIAKQSLSNEKNNNFDQSINSVINDFNDRDELL